MINLGEQLELGATAEAPRVEIEDIARLERLLEGCLDWVTAAQVCVLLDQIPNDNNKRKLRAIANRSHHLISGQKGYRYTRHATADEIHHFAAWLRTQAKEMDERAGRVLKAAHAKLG